MGLYKWYKTTLSRRRAAKLVTRQAIETVKGFKWAWRHYNNGCPLEFLMRFIDTADAAPRQKETTRWFWQGAKACVRAYYGETEENNSW